MKIRRTKPYVCIDVDYAEHARFQATGDLEAAAGTWLRCLAHSRGQEQDGLVTAGWLRRTFATNYDRVEELVRVGLLKLREDGNYEIHAYAPRNQTREMLDEDRTATRERVRQWRRSEGPKRPDVTRYKGVTNAVVTIDADALPASTPPQGAGSAPTHENGGSHPASLQEPRAALAPSVPCPLSIPLESQERIEESSGYAASGVPVGPAEVESVTRYKSVTSVDVTAYENVSNALVPTSTSTSINTSTSSLAFTSSSFPLSSFPDLSISRDHVISVPRAPTGAPAREGRQPLPPSERSVSGPFWLSSFAAGIQEQTGRPCTVGRVYLETLERIVTHHAPHRDAPRASAWLKDQAKAFAAQWDGKHPAKGLTPDGLERWLNEGRQGPPTFGRAKIVQPSADQWHEDDWSDLGATVGE